MYVFLKENKNHKLALDLEMSGVPALISRLITKRLINEYIASKLIENKSKNKNNPKESKK